MSELNANQLVDTLRDAKLALWAYLSSEETTYLPLDVYDLREEYWSCKPTSDDLKWGWKGGDDWEYEVDEVITTVSRDGLTFVWYRQDDELQWGVFKADNTPPF